MTEPNRPIWHRMSRRQLTITIVAVFVAIVAAIIIIPQVTIDSTGPSFKATPTREDGARNFRNHLLAMGKTQKVADASAASAKSNCDLIDHDNGSVARMIYVVTHYGAGPQANAELIRGMQQYVCPQHAAAIDAFFANLPR